MPLPDASQFNSPTVTENQYKEAQSQLIEHIKSLAAKSEVVNAVTPKADKTYVDNVLSSFQNGAIKTYPTLAAANADIANIALNTKVSVLSEADGGDYYKATANATSLTKSPYDSLKQSKDYTDQLFKKYFNVVTTDPEFLLVITDNAGNRLLAIDRSGYTHLNLTQEYTDVVKPSDTTYQSLVSLLSLLGNVTTDPENLFVVSDASKNTLLKIGRDGMISGNFNIGYSDLLNTPQAPLQLGLEESSSIVDPYLLKVTDNSGNILIAVFKNGTVDIPYLSSSTLQVDTINTVLSVLEQNTNSTEDAAVTTAILEKLPVRADNRYGYNFAPFSQNTIVTKFNKQYVIVVDENRNPIILQRDVGTYNWNKFDLSTIAENPLLAPTDPDGHNNYSVIVTKDGYIMVTGNHHNYPCRAVISNSPGNITAWTQIKYTTSNVVTYPRFLQFADLKTMAFWREGSSGNGKFYFSVFDDATRLFKEKVLVIDATASNPYEQCIGIGLDGSLHLCWGYRTNGGSANANYGMFYAKSMDQGQTWTNAAGTQTYALPLSESNSEKIFNAPERSGYVNQNGACCDLNGLYHTVIFQYDAEGKTQIVHIWFDGTSWKSETVSDFDFRYDLSASVTSNEISRPLIGCTGTGKLFVIYHTINMNRQNDIRIIDVTKKSQPKDMCMAKFNTYLLELTCNTDYMLNDNELVMLVSKGVGGNGIAAYANQPIYLLTAPLP
ncbi:BNR repeat-containing protein [Acinetobacter sp. UGAL515B_02]|nr:BNR-4 repeat-containing protein [Acinetobacter sp. UGAL515B_02]WON81467.1 BNR repeat-containing protein [Acinetobacter sp. UGAL515B_02]